MEIMELMAAFQHHNKTDMTGEIIERKSKKNETGMEMALRCDQFPGRNESTKTRKQPMRVTRKVIEIDHNHSSKPKLGLAWQEAVGS